MSENMICPACHEFQPKAEVCAKCGVVVAKAQQSASPASTGGPAATEAETKGGLPLVPFALGLAVIAAGSYFMIGSNPEPPASPPPVHEAGAIQKMTSQLDEAKTVVPAADTRETIRALVQRFDLLAVRPQGFNPPSPSEGLGKLVDDGLARPEQITDAWGQVLVYELVTGVQGPVGQNWQVRLHSIGPDGVDGTADDVHL